MSTEQADAPAASTTPELWSPFVTPPYAGWAPYCLVCNTMRRMVVTAYGWRCEPCGNPIGPDGKHWHGAP